jgi:uncharacterized membrane protein
MFGAGYGSMVAMMVVGTVFWLALLAGAGWLLYTLIRSLSPGPRASQTPDDPWAILQIRYARGELTREQFEDMRRVMRGDPSGPA